MILEISWRLRLSRMFSNIEEEVRIWVQPILTDTKKSIMAAAQLDRFLKKMYPTNQNFLY